MKHFIPYIALLIVTIGLNSCKKDVIEEPIPDQTPVFKVEGSIGNDSFLMQAGVNDFYMNTFSESRNGVKYYAGKIEGDGISFELGIYDGKLDIPGYAMANNLPESLSFTQILSQPIVHLSKELFPNADLIQNVNWYKDGVFIGANTADIFEPGIYNVCAKVLFTGSSVTTSTLPCKLACS